MDKNASLKFNKIVDKFLNELHTILPDEKNIVIFQSQVSVAVMVDPNKVLKSFIKYGLPYKEHIVNKNEDFFLGDKVSVKQDYMSEALHLKELWKNKLSDENKSVVWKYFQVMTVLAERANTRNNK